MVINSKEKLVKNSKEKADNKLKRKSWIQTQKTHRDTKLDTN